MSATSDEEERGSLPFNLAHALPSIPPSLSLLCFSFPSFYISPLFSLYSLSSPAPPTPSVQNSAGNLYKGHARRKPLPLSLSLPLPSYQPTQSHSLWQVHSFTGVGTYFLRIPVYTEEQLRHPALWTGQLLGPWTFH